MTRTPVLWIFPHDIGMVFIRRIMEIHFYGWSAEEFVLGDSDRRIVPAPSPVILIIVAMMARAVISAILGIINVIVGSADLNIHAWYRDIHSHMHIIRPYRWSGQSPYDQSSKAQSGFRGPKY
jgi:hypothetical protein